MEGKIRLSISELITIVSVVVSVTTGYVMLRADVKSLKKEVNKIENKLDTIEVEQYRMNGILNFVFAEEMKHNWKMSPSYAERLLKDVEEFKLEQKKLKTP